MLKQTRNGTIASDGALHAPADTRSALPHCVPYCCRPLACRIAGGLLRRLRVHPLGVRCSIDGTELVMTSPPCPAQHLPCCLAAERHRGDAMQLFLQELCSHEPLAPTQHSKYAAPGASGGGAPAAPAATLSLRLRPAAAARQQQGGLLSQLGAAGKDKGPDGVPVAWVECALQVCGAGRAQRRCSHPGAAQARSGPAAEDDAIPTIAFARSRRCRWCRLACGKQQPVALVLAP